MRTITYLCRNLRSIRKLITNEVRLFSTYGGDDGSDFDISALENIVKLHTPVSFSPLTVDWERYDASQPFCSTQIDVYPYLKDKKGNVLQRGDLDNLETEDGQSYDVSLDQMYPSAYEVLKNVCETGTMPLPSGLGFPVASLMLFLAQKGIEGHEKALLKLNKLVTPAAEKMTEGDLSAILSAHLVSQLAGQSPKSYMVSMETKGRNRLCPCGCLTEITYGYPDFGSKELWHGKPGIMAFPFGGGNVNILILENFIDDDVQVEGENINLDEEKENEPETVTMQELSPERMNYITAQTIAFGIYQKVFQRRLKFWQFDFVSLIPTLALSADEAHIFMYDVKHDICLKNSTPLPFWEKDQLNLNTLVTLWMTFYHLSFKPSLPEEAIEELQNSCGFLEKMNAEELKVIENSMRKKKIVL